MHTIPPVVPRIERSAGQAGSVSDVVGTINNKYSAELSKSLRAEFGLGNADCRIVAHIALNGPATSAEVGRGLNIDKALVSRCLARLRKKGVVTTAHLAGGAKEIALTDVGLRLHYRAVQVEVSLEERLLQGLNESERRHLFDLLHKLQTNLPKVAELTAMRNTPTPKRA